jgi:hypothetical protein
MQSHSPAKTERILEEFTPKKKNTISSFGNYVPNETTTTLHRGSLGMETLKTSLKLIKPPIQFDGILKKLDKSEYLETKDKYKKLRKMPDFRMTIDEEKSKKMINANNSSTFLKNIKNKSRFHLEEKVRNFTANLSHLKKDNDGFHKSLDLVNGLIKGLDSKIQKIREFKEGNPRLAQPRNSINY